MKQVIAKSILGLVICSFIGIFVFLITVEDNTDVWCYDASNEVEKKPSVETVSDFMNLNTDGEGSYLHLALFGRLFALYPDLFQEVYEAADTKKHHYFNDLRLGGDAIFEYHPELKPKVFDEVYLKSKWISNKN